MTMNLTESFFPLPQLAALAGSVLTTENWAWKAPEVFFGLKKSCLRAVTACPACFLLVMVETADPDGALALMVSLIFLRAFPNLVLEMNCRTLEWLDRLSSDPLAFTDLTLIGVPAVSPGNFFL